MKEIISTCTPMLQLDIGPHMQILFVSVATTVAPTLMPVLSKNNEFYCYRVYWKIIFKNN